jgi:hypothetical protein
VFSVHPGDNLVLERVVMNQVLVEPDGLVVSPGSDDLFPGREQPRPGLFRLMVAAVIGALAAGTLLLVGEGNAGMSPLSHKNLIQAHLDAWYGGDFETAHSLRAPERVRTGPSEDRVRAEVAYQATLHARAEVLDCEELPPSTIRCDVAYSNALNEAVEAAPAIVAQQFGMSDGLLLFVAGPYLEDEELTASFREFANQQFPSEYEEACVDEPNYQPPGCGELKMRHLDDWAAWHRSRDPDPAN